MGTLTVKVPRIITVKGRYYWRPTPAVKKLGFHNEALGTDLGKAIERAKFLNAEVDAEVGRAPKQEASPRQGTVADLIRIYRRGERYKNLAPKTSREYDYILNRIEKTAGHVPVHTITRKGLMRTYSKLREAGKLRTANATMQMWAILLKTAYNEGWTDAYIAERMELSGTESRERVWTAEEVEIFCAKAVEVGRSSMALAVRLAYDLGQRQGDILRLAWGQYERGGFTITQRKTKTKIAVPIGSQALRIHLDATTDKQDSLVIVVSEVTKRPYKPDYFRHEFQRIRGLAELPGDLQFRDLRRTAATEMGRTGATDDEIRAVTGHKTRNVVARYVRPDATMAASAQAKRNKPRSDV